MIRLSILAVLLALPLGALAVLHFWTDDEIEAVREYVSPVVTSATARTVTGSVPAQVEIAEAPGRTLAAPDWHGRVTAVSVGPGSTLRTGTTVLAVDAIARVAVASPEPFYRRLEAGDRGRDVRYLNDTLVALGYLSALPSPDDAYRTSTSQAVKEWAEALGVDEPDGSFDPGWVVFLPMEDFEVGEVAFDVGGRAPAPGTALAKEAPRILKARLLSANSSDPLVLEQGVEYAFFANEQTFQISPPGEIAEPELPRLAKIPRLPGQLKLSGIVQRTVPLQVVAVPSTAVQSGRNGGLCVWVDSTANGYEAIAVVLAGSRSGVTSVRSGLQEGQTVLVNPADALEHPECPSK